MDGAKSFRWLVAEGRSLAVLCAVLFSTLFTPVAPVLFTSPPVKNDPLPSAPAPVQPMGDMLPRAYLPIIMNGKAIPAGIYGYVTQSGFPAAGVTLLLRHISTNPEETIATTLTDTNGYYSFINVPPISSGSLNEYFVRYSYDQGNNDKNPGRLSHWSTRKIQSYTANQIVNIDDFEISDVVLEEPARDVQCSVPITFMWDKRPQATTDSYQLTFSGGYTTPSLGYVDTYLLSDLNGMLTNPEVYSWYIIIYAPDGAKGASRFMRPITFLP